MALLEDNDLLKNKIFAFIATLNNFMLYLLETPTPILKVILSVLSVKLVKEILNENIFNLIHFFEILPADKIVAVIKAFSANLDLNAANKAGEALAHIAACYGNVAVIHALHGMDDDSNKADHDGTTPADIDNDNGHTAATQALYSAPINDLVTLLSKLITNITSDPHHKRHRSLGTNKDYKVKTLRNILKIIQKQDQLSWVIKNKRDILTLIASVCHQHRHYLSSFFFQPASFIEFQTLVKEKGLVKQNENIMPVPLSTEEISNLSQDDLDIQSFFTTYLQKNHHALSYEKN